MIQPLPPRFRALALALLVAIPGLAIPAGAPAAASSAESADRLSYVLLSAGGRNASMSGTTDDLRRAKALRGGSEALLYIRQGGSAYVVRDAAILRRAEAIFEPQKALGAKQAELGSRQAALGSRQAALGSEQGRLGRLQADASPARAAILGRQQADLGKRQDALGRQQDVLGREQSQLGREQERLGREADAKLRTLVAEAISSGAAQRVN
jgi:hypothetical protein